MLIHLGEGKGGRGGNFSAVALFCMCKECQKKRDLSHKSQQGGEGAEKCSKLMENKRKTVLKGLRPRPPRRRPTRRQRDEVE